VGRERDAELGRTEDRYADHVQQMDPSVELARQLARVVESATCLHAQVRRNEDVFRQHLPNRFFTKRSRPTWLDAGLVHGLLMLGSGQATCWLFWGVLPHGESC